MRDLSIYFFIFTIFCCVDGQDTTPAFCSLPKDEGTGIDVTVYMYYNNATDNCYPFRYTGAGGNDNRFIAEHHCMRNCSARADSVYPKDRATACHFQKAPGDCFGNYLRYYYDPVLGKCKTFSWTGCVGNGNRFLDLQHCNATCFGIKDEGDKDMSEEDESDTPVGIILGIVLGVIGAIILIAVLVLTLKNKSSPKKSKEKQSKQETTAAVEQSPLQHEKIEMA